jgi:hypothetical protein
MFPWLKGDRTIIVQLRNELRGNDRIYYDWRESTGSNLVYLSPQLNHLIRGKWNISLIADIPLWQYLNGTQLAMKYGISLNLARDFALSVLLKIELFLAGLSVRKCPDAGSRRCISRNGLTQRGNQPG